MPFSLHPSGFCCWYEETNVDNLIAGRVCPLCKRVAGHDRSCPSYKLNDKVSSSRPSLFNATAVLWGMHSSTNFITFTLPSLADKTYQRSDDCPDTGDVAITSKFSKILEAWSLKEKRGGRKLSYAWVAEAQMERQEKFGGVGDIHFHLVTNIQLKTRKGKRFADRKTFEWLQGLWCSHVGVESNNCVHVDFIPPGINSIPAYMSKYMGKGSNREILSRRFFATRDLSRFKKIALNSFPEADIHRQTIHTLHDGFEVTLNYLDTRQVLELYGPEMIEQGQLSGSRTGPGFSPTEIADRQQLRLHLQAINELQAEERAACDERVTYAGASAYTRKLAERVRALSGKKSPPEA